MNQMDNTPDWNAILRSAQDFQLPKRSWLIALVILIAWSIIMSWYTVPAESVGLIQRFGKYEAEVGPGLHFKIPFGVDEVTLVPVKRQLKESPGLRY